MTWMFGEFPRIKLYDLEIINWPHPLYLRRYNSLLVLRTPPISALSSFKNGLACCLVCPPVNLRWVLPFGAPILRSVFLWDFLEGSKKQIMMWCGLVWMKEDTGCCSLWNWLLFLSEKHCDFFSSRKCVTIFEVFSSFKKWIWRLNFFPGGFLFQKVMIHYI